MITRRAVLAGLASCSLLPLIGRASTVAEYCALPEDWEMLARLVLVAHIPVVIVEAILLGVVVRYLERVKPEMLQDAGNISSNGTSH